MNQNFIIEDKTVTITDSVLKFFIFVTVLLPTGSIFGVNLKMLSLGAFLLLLILAKKNIVILKTVFSLVPVTLFLLASSLYSFIIYKYDSSYIFFQAKDIFVFFLMFYILMQYAKFENKHGYIADTITKSLYYVGLIKIIILLYSFYIGLPVSFVILNISDFLNVPIMTYDVEDTYISRINFTSDLIIPISVFYLLMKFYRGGYSKFDTFMLILILFSAFITMSRFQWAFTLVAIIFAILLNISNKKSFITLLFLTSLAFLSLTFQSVQEALLARFDEKLVSASDFERIIQRQGIEQAISEAPLFGNGIGYYIPNLIRSDLAKYSYELQLHALVMQLGFVGFIMIMVMIIVPLLKCGNGLPIKTYILYLILICIWVSSALFNPMLFSSAAGVAMALFYMISRLSWLRYHRV